MSPWLALVVIPLAAALLYLYGRSRKRLVAIGRDTYVRFYPNPGVGVRLGSRRAALSVVGGAEWYVRRIVRDASGNAVHVLWGRTWSAFSRAKGKAEKMRALGGR